MLSYCLKCRKNTESKNPKIMQQKNVKWCFYKTLWFVIVKNRDLLKRFIKS